jgi:hypothetical protein
MDDMLFVQVRKRVSHLGDILWIRYELLNSHPDIEPTHPATPLIVEFPKLRKLLVQLSLRHEFEYEEDTFGVVKVAIEP